MNPETLIEKLNARYACKKFDETKKISDVTWNALEEAMRLTPSSFGLQPWKFIVVKDASLRSTLRKHSWNQNQIETASHLLVIATKTDMTAKDVDSFLEEIAHTRNIPVQALTEYGNMMKGFIGNFGDNKEAVQTWTAKQGYIALGFLLESAAILDLDACPMEGFDAAQYNELLGLNNSGFTATVVCTVGYRASDDATSSYKKVRFNKEKVIEYR
jgi:nitroreductase